MRKVPHHKIIYYVCDYVGVAGLIASDNWFLNTLNDCRFMIRRWRRVIIKLITGLF